MTPGAACETAPGVTCYLDVLLFTYELHRAARNRSNTSMKIIKEKHFPYMHVSNGVWPGGVYTWCGRQIYWGSFLDYKPAFKGAHNPPICGDCVYLMVGAQS